jgi:hypothetical protein
MLERVTHVEERAIANENNLVRKIHTNGPKQEKNGERERALGPWRRGDGGREKKEEEDEERGWFFVGWVVPLVVC